MKKLIQLLLLTSLCITMISCNTSKQYRSDTDITFKNTWVNFINAFNERKIQGMNKYINPDYGLFLLFKNGLYTAVSDYDSFNDFGIKERDFDNVHLIGIKIDCELKKGKKPYYDCSKGWDKEGCFLDKSPDLKVSDYITLTEEGRPVEVEIPIGSEVTKTYLVYNTEGTIGFYFGKVNDKWHLLCIDRVEPCEV